MNNLQYEDYTLSIRQVEIWQQHLLSNLPKYHFSKYEHLN